MNSEKTSNFRKLLFPGKFNKTQQLQKSLDRMKNNVPEIPTATYHENLAKCHMNLGNTLDAQRELLTAVKLWRKTISKTSRFYESVENVSVDNLLFCYWSLIQNSMKLKQDEMAAVYALEAAFLAKDYEKLIMFQRVMPYALNGTKRVDALRLLISNCIENEQYEKALHETDQIWMITLKEKNNRRGGFEFDPTLRDCELITMCILIFQEDIEKSARHEQLLTYYTTVYETMEKDDKIAAKYSDLPTDERRVFKQFLLFVKNKDIEEAAQLLPDHSYNVFNNSTNNHEKCTFYSESSLTLCKLIFKRICDTTFPDF